MVTCDIFCTVIDNFGDIGVCWRLARQLANEYDWRVRLWVDNLTAFAKICAAVDPQAHQQSINNVIIKCWHTDFEEKNQLQSADIVLEAFGCDLPSAYLVSMVERAASQRAPVWINLEYLSAEDWIADFHLRPSPHPRYPLLKTCFFPGLTPGTGGVLKERSLCETRQSFLNNSSAQAALWNSLRIPPPDPAATIVSLFAYQNNAINALLASWCESATPVVCLVPEGLISNAVAHFLNLPNLAAGTVTKRGALTVYGIPFVDQNAYDQLLWACDINFVRGEDSFVRAQWAHRPFVWHIYPQPEQAHLPKLDAALTHYAEGLPAQARTALIDFWHAWNRADTLSLNWHIFWQHRQLFAQHAHSWAQKLAAIGNLSDHIVKFCKTQLQ